MNKAQQKILPLYVRFVQEHQKRCIGSYEGMRKKDIIKYFKSYHKMYNISIQIIEEGKNIIGFCTYYITKVPYTNKKCLYICDLFIDKKFRHKGHGKKLMNDIEDIGRKNKCVYMNLGVHDSNRIAKNLYYDLGFIDISHQMIKNII